MLCDSGNLVVDDEKQKSVYSRRLYRKDKVTSKYISKSQSSLGTSVDSIISPFRRSDDSNESDCWYKVAMFAILG